MKKILVLIFILAVCIRFLYYPENVYFAYDSARDSFAALDILKGDLKIVGPPTSLNGNFFHGVLFYYLVAPFLLLGDKNPEWVSSFLRLGNALGVFLVFLIGRNLFNKSVGLLAAFLYAISYEQTQYSLLYGHPSLTVISVLIFYFGLSLVIFRGRQYGLPISLMGLGLSIQFEAVYALLVIPLVALAIILREKFKKISFKIYLLSLLAFAATLVNYLLAEIKFDFRSSKALFSGVSQALSLDKKSGSNLSNFLDSATRLVHDNFFAQDQVAGVLLVLFLIISIILYKKRTLRNQIIFLTAWLTLGLLPNLISNNYTYYFSAGASVALIILVANLLINFRFGLLSLLALIVILVSNFSLTLGQNAQGPNSDIIIQPGMLVTHQKQALDYIYQNAESQNFSVNAITVPLNVNTTWSYLFEWYGQEKYGYLPVWGGEAASGFPGNLKTETVRSILPKQRFTIIEPTIGIPEYQIKHFLAEENFFSKVVDERSFGTIIVQKRVQY